MPFFPVLLAFAVQGGPEAMVRVPGGSYSPLYPADPARPQVTVPGFLLDAVPVTNARFASFVAGHPAWRRDRVPEVFADTGYLRGWIDPLTPAGRPEQPVVEVSWFAARAYCESRGARLPTEDEWEIAASADATRADARSDPAWAARILAWYGSPPHDLPDVGQSTPNVFGVHDLHGVVWEWVEDFNNTVYGADVREGGEDDRLRFCGAGALGAADASDYANFMRVALRSSLEGRSTTRSLGFRCARDGGSP